MKKFSFKLLWQSLKDAFKGFSDDKLTKLSASLAYYTVFSLAPLLIIIIAVCGYVLGREAIEGGITHQIEGFVGADAAKQVQDMIRNAAVSGKGTMASIIGGVTLLIGATTMFGDMQDSINSIWGIKPKPKVGIMKTIKNRLLSFGLIGSIGFLLLVSLAASAMISGLGDKLKAIFPGVSVALFFIINLALTLVITSILFMVIFKVLPDVKMKWKAVLPGAIATSILFLIGKSAISLYIGTSDVGKSYGAAGSLVVLLLWIYYSSIILYFGAEFTKAYAINEGARIVPNEYAQWDADAKVPGARKGSPSERYQRKPQNRQEPQVALAGHRRQGSKPGQEKKKAPGMGTVLLGLALYYFKTSAERKNGQSQA